MVYDRISCCSIKHLDGATVATTLIEPNDSDERQHRANLRSLLEQVEGTVRIASAYVTNTSLLLRSKRHDVRLLTYISRMDIIFGATSLQSLQALIEAGMECRYLSREPRLHAKVYLFGSRAAVVTSANLTQKALDRNLEVGVRFDGIAVAQLVDWFDKLWDQAQVLVPEVIIAWRRETEAERTELFALRKRVEKQPQLSSHRATELRNLFASDSCLYICNTNRKYSLNDEKTMHQRGYAAAWENFRFPSHMNRVKEGDTICMYAKGKGITASEEQKARSKNSNRGPLAGSRQMGNASGECQLTGWFGKMIALSVGRAQTVHFLNSAQTKDCAKV